MIFFCFAQHISSPVGVIDSLAQNYGIILTFLLPRGEYRPRSIYSPKINTLIGQIFVGHTVQ